MDARQGYQLQILKDVAFKIIDFISQFEDELVKIWNKPKFVLNSNYVITLDKIMDTALSESQIPLAPFIKGGIDEYNLYHKPLLLTLVNSVNTEDSDLLLFFNEIEKIAKNEIKQDLLDESKLKSN